jgi:MFS superfamily sulfate permease-like transporter
VFVVTMVTVLLTDLLIGVAVGVAVKFLIHMFHGVPFRSMFRPQLAVQEIDGQTNRIKVGQSAVFSNWIPLKRQIESYGLLEGRNIVLDMSDTHIVDHNVMERLHTMEQEFQEQQLELKVVGLEGHLSATGHHLATRQRKLASIRRLTIVVAPEIERELEHSLIEKGATGYTAMPCHGIGKHDLHNSANSAAQRVRIEVIAPAHVVEQMLEYLAGDIMPKHSITACVETVDVLRLDAFTNSIEQRSTH